jgi:Zn ribbon nucleic-acid-binding protein
MEDIGEIRKLFEGVNAERDTAIDRAEKAEAELAALRARLKNAEARSIDRLVGCPYCHADDERVVGWYSSGVFWFECRACGNKGDKLRTRNAALKAWHGLDEYPHE